MKPFILAVLSSFIVCSCSSSRMAANSQESTAVGTTAGPSSNATSSEALSTKPVGFNANTKEVVRRGGDSSGRQLRVEPFDTK